MPIIEGYPCLTSPIFIMDLCRIQLSAMCQYPLRVFAHCHAYHLLMPHLISFFYQRKPLPLLRLVMDFISRRNFILFCRFIHSHKPWHQVSVRWVRCLPKASFRFHLTMDTLAFGCSLPTVSAAWGLALVRIRSRWANKK